VGDHASGGAALGALGQPALVGGIAGAVGALGGRDWRGFGFGGDLGGDYGLGGLLRDRGGILAGFSFGGR
jgi:hypothetical protein